MGFEVKMKKVLLSDISNLPINNNKIQMLSFEYQSSSFEKNGLLKIGATVETISGQELLINIIVNGVQDFSVVRLSGPVSIDGFEIIDHSDDGWIKDACIEVTDFEDGKIHFIAKNIRIIPA